MAHGGAVILCWKIGETMLGTWSLSRENGRANGRGVLAHGKNNRRPGDGDPAGRSQEEQPGASHAESFR
jgi:hypothetical protein